MKPRYWATLTILASVLVGYVLMDRWGRPPSASDLATRVMSARSSDERMAAAVELCSLQGPEAVVQMRRLVTDCDDVNVKVAMLSGLADHRDGESSLLFLAAMASQNQAMRQAGFLGAQKVLGFEEEKFSFRADDPQPKRDAVVQALRDEYGERRVRPSPPATAAATTETPAPAAPVGAPATPTASPTAAPATSLVPMAPPVGVSGYSGIQVVVWTCRFFALLIFLADLAGALGLIFSEMGLRGSAKAPKPAHKQSASVTEEVDKAQARISLGVWIKSAFLVAGLFSVIALLVTAELIQLAVRVEQRIEYQSRTR